MTENRRLAAAFVQDIKQTHQSAASEIVKQLSDEEVERICQVRFAAAGELTNIEVAAAERRQKAHEQELAAEASNQT